MATLEYESLDRRWDHEKPLPATARERYAASLEQLGLDGANLVHVGHSTHLLALGAARFLTDPWFSDPAFGALRHERGPAVGPGDVGRLDAILVSHDHPDHADLDAMDRMDKQARVLVATAALAARVRARGFRDVSVLAPGEETQVADVRVAAVPAQHDVYEVGFVLTRASSRGTDCVYFAGDTRLFPGLEAIRERYAPSAAILPVDGTRVRGRELAVMRPEDAAVAMTRLDVRVAVPSHADAYVGDLFARHALLDYVPKAAERFVQIARTRAKANQRVVSPVPGELVSLV